MVTEQAEQNAGSLHMMVTNPLRYLVFLEGGAVALLATALAKHGHTQPAKSQVDFWASFAELCKLQLSNVGPETVALEYDGTDLLIVWDDWAITIEAKMSAAFVRSGQLQTYYNRLRPRLGEKGVLANASSMAVIFLTPVGVGNDEFESLSIDPKDRKLHLDWTTVLSRIELSFSPLEPAPEDQQQAFLRSLVLHGASRIRELLSNGASRPMGVTWTNERRRCREFAKQVQNRIVGLCDDEELHFNPIWSDVNGDELFANFGGERAGNVYFFISSDSRIHESDLQPSKLIGRLYFKLALRASAERKNRFQTLVGQPLKALLDAYNISVDYNASSVTSVIELSRPRSELCDEIASLYFLYLIVFRKLMK